MERRYNHAHDHPVLARIDRARKDHYPPFASAPDADDLEIIARALVDEYWSDYALLTGNVPEGAFTIVCERLESHRRPLPLPPAASHARRDRARRGQPA